MKGAHDALMGHNMTPINQVNQGDENIGHNGSTPRRVPLNREQQLQIAFESISEAYEITKKQCDHLNQRLLQTQAEHTAKVSKMQVRHAELNLDNGKLRNELREAREKLFQLNHQLTYNIQPKDQVDRDAISKALTAPPLMSVKKTVPLMSVVPDVAPNKNGATTHLLTNVLALAQGTSLNNRPNPHTDLRQTHSSSYKSVSAMSPQRRSVRRRRLDTDGKGLNVTGRRKRGGRKVRERMEKLASKRRMN